MKRILCDYRIIAIGVKDEEVAAQLKNRTYVAKGVSADEAAASVAISDIFQKIDITHMISFHSRLTLAEMTSNELNKIGIFSETVKGTMSTKNREKAFERFKKKSKAVLQIPLLFKRVLTLKVD